MISSDVLLQVIKCTTSVCDSFLLHNFGMGSDELLKVVLYASSSRKKLLFVPFSVTRSLSVDDFASWAGEAIAWITMSLEADKELEEKVVLFLNKVSMLKVRVSENGVAVDVNLEDHDTKIVW